jgi:hypothetical protein
MAGAIDLFAGISPIAGPNLFKVNKNPLDQIDTGVEDVIGQKAADLGNEITQLLQALINKILGLGLGFLQTGGGVLGTLDDIAKFFENTLAFLGELNPLSPTFNIADAARNFAQTILLPTNLVAGLVEDATVGLGLTGFVPIENLAMSEISAILGTAQAVIDAILATVGFVAGVGTATDVTHYFTDFLAMFANPALTSGGFNPATAVATFITDMITPTHLLAPLEQLVTGSFTVPPINVPGLDASKIVSGIFPQNMLDITSVPASTVTGILSPTNIPGLDASKIISGVLALALIPLLPASIITSGVFNAAQIPGLDASKIVSGVLGAAQIPALPAGWGKTIDGALIVNATAVETNINNELVNLENTLISNLGAIGSGYAAVGTAISTIPFVNVMAPWLESIGHAVQSLTDQLTSGLGASAVTGSNPGQAGQAATSVVNSVNNVSAIANAHATFISNQAITHPAMWGIDPTGSASFPLSTIASQTPAPTTNATSSNTVMAYIDTPFGGVKQSVAWLGDGTISGTYGIYVNVYSVDTTTNQATFVWSSGNIISAVSGGSVPLWNYANIPVAAYINTSQGQKWLAEIEIIGPGTYKVCGINGSWLNNNSAIAVGAMGATRTPAAYLASVTANGPVNVKNPSWTLTTVTGDNCILVDLTGFSNASAITALAVTCAGVAMTQKSFIRYNTGAAAWEYVAQFELHNTGFAAFTAGAKTIAVTTTGGGTTGTQCGVQGGASSYQNISAVGAATTTSGTTANPSQTATGLTANSNTITHSLLSGEAAATFTASNQNVIANIASATVTNATLVQDQLAYAASVPFTGTMIAGSWGASLFTLTSAQATPLQIPAVPFTPTLSNNVPWLMLCGAAGLSQLKTVTTQYTTAGNKTYTIPAQAINNAQAGARVYLDLVGIGGGAGSGGGISTGVSGAGNLSGGGGGGVWGGISLQLGVDIPLTTTSIAVHVGAGGTAGAVNSLQGGNGAATTFTITGYSGGVITYAGGLAGDGTMPIGGYNAAHNVYIDGASPGDYTFNSAPYYGGVQVVYESAGRDGSNLVYPIGGSSPGGGAAAGDVTSTIPANSGAAGAAGAKGYAAITVYQS